MLNRPDKSVYDPAMSQIGINTFLWTTDWSQASTASRILSTVKRLGFEAVQIPILSLDAFQPDVIGRIVADNGLTCYISAGLSSRTDITHEDSALRRAGTEYLKGCLNVAARLECSFLSGSFHSVFGKKADRPVDDDQWENSASCLKAVAREAQRLQMELVLEPINRYESFLVNTAAQAQRLISMIGEANVKIQLDTFHMNLEEEDYYETIVGLGEDLVHFHVAENHRGRFGRGTTPWDEIFRALSDIDYRGAIVIESFTPDVADVAVTACIWRQMAPSADALAAEGLAFLKALARKHRLD
jgi:D-psicose/D-tagatose/L-ribulose 3-epimerase